MKKLDLHIHTFPSLSDRTFDFSLDSLEEYVKKINIDCIAITNHNLFNKIQFKEICDRLTIDVLPGIEIDLEGGHFLLISENDELEDFDSKCSEVEKLIVTQNDSITFDQFKNIFPNMERYLIIPHYEKRPNLKEETIRKFDHHIFAGEVTSVRKFKSCVKDPIMLTPVIFSDSRIVKNMDSFSTRQTYIDANESSLRSIKGCFFDKAKVFLSKDEGNDFFQATDDGIILSTGLNVMIGERSTGKTHTLNKICTNFDNTKYIKQFSLLQNDDVKFKDLVTSRHSLISESYLKEFKDVVNDVNDVDLKTNNLNLERYIISLKKYALESDNLDSFSNCKLYNESKFEIDDDTNINRLINSSILLLENNEFKSIINKHIPDAVLKALIIDLVKIYTEIKIRNLKKRWINDLVEKIKGDLSFRSTTTRIEEIDFSKILMDKIKTKKFTEVVKKLQINNIIDSKDIRNFKVIAKTVKYTGAGQLKTKSRKKLSFSDAFANYNDPYKFLTSLKKIQELEEVDYCKYFVDIEYKILNKNGFEVSGGERSEFNLLHEISDALKYDLLLIDEPESSFDNLFLKNEVNEIIKEISTKIPVIIVTHNNTIGASIKPDHLLYTKKNTENEKVEYCVYFGHPTSEYLTNSKGESVKNIDILFNCLEAGQETYYERKNNIYEILKDRK